MKKFLSITLMLVALVGLFTTSCSSCHREKPVIESGLNYDEIVVADYDYMASQHPVFYYYETDVQFDSVLAFSKSTVINYIKNTFQVNDTCYQFEHFKDGRVDTTIVNDFWLECSPMHARNAVNFEQCMKIVEPYRAELKTRALTFRRVLAPPFPEEGQYIFGVGILVVDSETGAIERWDDEVTSSHLKMSE